MVRLHGRRMLHSVRRAPWLPAAGGALALGYMIYRLFLQIQADDNAPDGHKEPRPQTADKPPCDVLTSPAWRGRLATLTELSLAGCGLTVLPSTIGLCTNLRKLDLGGNDLVTLPDELASCFRLEILFVLGSRRMTKLPPVLGRMSSITRLGLRSNGLVALEGSNLPPNVVHLILTDNQISKIDQEAYKRLSQCRKLMLANNALQTFGGPHASKDLKNLELLRLANNQLDELDSQVLALPKLSWLALAGNPCVPPPTIESGLPIISLQDVSFDVGSDLGRGASGVVRGGVWKGLQVAVKTLAEKSSDGRALEELAVYRALAGDVPVALIRAVALVEPSAGEPVAAVVMEKLPKSVRDLAKPPTIVEVTRDIYPDAERFTIRAALAILQSAASALRHLHSRGVAHGDVYGHNILVDDLASLVKLGDFGASFSYSAFNAEQRRLMERLEVRAFGVLAAELGTRLAGGGATRAHLLGLADRCLGADVSRRPGFGDVCEVLKHLESGIQAP
ncbi:hypothetical protein M885DRAFT_526998 [Pelagophyceae sp. CCMP2097]|nr:hypothetical protein M885DRAFT_526998 [Pelagophyceae sp. CCMP2097]